VPGALPRRRRATWLRAAPPNGGETTYAYTTTGALRRLGACSSDDAARRAVERAVGTEEGAPGAADSGGRTPFRPVPTRPCSPTA
jgi:hypothetical protein